MQRLLLLAFLCLVQFTNAQFGRNCELRQFKINLFNPGVEYEMSLGVNTTLDVRAAWQLSLDPFTQAPLENVEPFPALTAQTRYYYNFGQRESNGRSIYGNSANYIAPSVAVLHSEQRFVEGQIVQGAFATAGLVTGLQRTFNSGLSFSLDVGAAYYLGPFEGGIHPVFNFSLGWVVSEKRWCVGK